MGEQIILRDYQRIIVDKVKSNIQDGLKTSVIAACPCSGKTEMAFVLLEEIEFKKALIVAHGTNVIKSQWEDRIPDSLKTKSIDIRLQQSLHSKIEDINQYDVVIIDEAHEFTFAEVTSECLDDFSGKHTVYLTGTPSKFIQKGFKCEIISAMELIQKGFMADLYCRLFSTNVEFKDSDHNEKGDLSEIASKKLVDSCEHDLDKLLECVYRQLKAGITKGSPSITNIVKQFPSFGFLDKTLIACSSIEHADKVGEYFANKKINYLVSHSKNDIHSDNVEKFSNDDSVKVLVVVDRCILGYNLVDLVNVVDMTGSKNIDIIYQLYARVMRKKGNVKKFFYKLCPENNSDIYKFYLQASLCLMNGDFISRFNGKNLNDMEIPTVINKVTKKDKDEPQEVDENEDDCDDKSKPKKAPSLNVDSFFYETVCTSNLLIDVYNKKGDVLSEIAFCRILDIRTDFGDWGGGDVEGNKKKIVEFILKNKKRPSQSSKNPKEKKLGQSLYSYTSESSDCYDPEFTEKISKLNKKIGYLSPSETKDLNQKEIVEFILKNKKRPSQSSKNPKEKKLGQSLSHYTSESSGSYDPEFTEKIKQVAYSVGIIKYMVGNPKEKEK
jgi:superfamily II DNA or RNA helicase